MNALTGSWDDVSASWQMNLRRDRVCRADPAWMAVTTFTPDDAVSRRGIELLSSGNLTDFGNLNVTAWSYVDTITFSFYMRKGALPDTEQIPRRCCEVVEELCTDFVPKTTAGGGS